MSGKVVILKNESDVIARLCTIIEQAASDSISKDNRFTVGLSGGSLIKYLCIGLSSITTDWSKWLLFFCDERVVPEKSQDSTFGCYKKDLLDKVPLLESQFIKIKQGVSAEEAAVDYREKLVEHFGKSLPRFNMLLLGMGPDGHTCSLFPGHTLLEETALTVASITDSPKPPPERITLTYPVINNAERIVFALSGAGKAEMLKRIFKDKESLPAARVSPIKGELFWLADEEACSLMG